MCNDLTHTHTPTQVPRRSTTEGTKIGMDSSPWTLHPGFFILDSSSWTLHPGFFVLGSSSWLLHPGLFILDSSSGTLPLEFFILAPPFWICLCSVVQPGLFTQDSLSWGPCPGPRSSWILTSWLPPGSSPCNPNPGPLILDPTSRPPTQDPEIVIRKFRAMLGGSTARGS